MLSKIFTTDYDIVTLQEQYVDFKNLTRSTMHWRVLYPMLRDPDMAGWMHSAMLISKRLSTNSAAWAQATRRLCMDKGVHESVWMGDLNHHHLQWDDHSNAHLFTRWNLEHLELLIHYITKFHMDMVLPPKIAALEVTHTKNRTHPNNIFCTEGILEQLCLYAASPADGLVSDHFPIQTVFDILTEAVPVQP